MKRIAIGATLVASAILLSACGGGAVGDYDAPEPVQQQPTISNEYVETQANYGTVERVIIDGYTCFVFDGSSNGGIWCDSGTVTP